MNRMRSDESDLSPRDFAARAAWLSHVGGLTQDQIAQELGISRQRAQRLVARAASEGLIRIRIDHVVADCLELERALVARFGIASARVSPGLARGQDPLQGLAPFAAPVVEQVVLNPEPQIISVGTGRTLRSVVEQMQALDGAHHKIVSLVGNVSPDGLATAYEVVVRLAEKLNAPHYPMSIPVVARTAEECELYLSLPHVQATLAVARQSHTAIVGLGQMSADAPLYVDGFITEDELHDLQAQGAVGEMVGHVFDGDGNYIDHPVNERNIGIPISAKEMEVLCIAGGDSKLPALAGALRGGLITRLVTDEHSATALLS